MSFKSIFRVCSARTNFVWHVLQVTELYQLSPYIFIWRICCIYRVPNFSNKLRIVKSMIANKRALNPLRPRQNGRHFADDTLNSIFLNENVIISIEISLKFAPKSPIDKIPSLVHIMAWHRPGDKPISEPMMVSLLTHTCVTRPQWVNTTRFVTICF